MVATDVLEHVDDDALALRELHRVAAPGARLVMTVPAFRWLWSEEDDRLGHRRRYTRKQLRHVAEQSGWEPLFATYFNLLLLAPIAVARRFRDRRDAGRGAAAQRSELNLTPGWLNDSAVGADAPRGRPDQSRSGAALRGVDRDCLPPRTLTAIWATSISIRGDAVAICTREFSSCR